MASEPGNVDLSIIIPAYNEEARLGPTLEAYVAQFGPMHGESWELLVVLNGCTDGTEGVVEGCRRRCPQVRYVVYPRPLGKGGALIEGLRLAAGARMALVDADNMVGPAETARLIDALDGSDMAIGWRRSASSHQPMRRRIAHLLVHLWTRWFLGLPYHDTQCGAKALRGSAAALVVPHLRELEWALDVEMLVAARRLGLAVVEVPVAWSHVPEDSKVRLLGAAWGFFRSTWRLRLGRGLPGPR